MTYSVVIPVYEANDHLDICLLSILGQKKHENMEVVCVPLTGESLRGRERLEQWHKRDGRVLVADDPEMSSANLYDALRLGIANASGEYILFMNQTDIVTSIDNLSEAFETARQLDVQVLLTTKEQRMDVDAFSPSERFVPNEHLLPQKMDSKVYSLEDIGVNIFIISPPIVYGNIYQRQFLLELFQFPHIFGNAGDFAVSQIALLHARRVSHTDVATIRSRYESCLRPLLTAQELEAVSLMLESQITTKLAADNAESIVQNILMFYLAHLLSSYHPFRSFLHVAEHYRSLCQHLSDNVANDATHPLYGCHLYVSSIAGAEPEALIESYTMPVRGIVFRGYIVRPVLTV